MYIWSCFKLGVGELWPYLLGSFAVELGEAAGPSYDPSWVSLRRNALDGWIRGELS